MARAGGGVAFPGEDEMRSTMRLLAGVVLLTLVATDARAQANPADYDRAMGLRERWMSPDRNVADPATWVDGTSRFYYRKTVQGRIPVRHGRCPDRAAAPAFDHEKLAAGLARP